MGTESASMETSATLSVGAPIYTSDGKRFATVKDVRGGYFELDVPRQRDFWLSATYVDSVNEDAVQLSIDRDQVDEHRLKQPGIERSDAQAPTDDAVLSSDEALAQRERMERELQAQRERMGRSADSGLVGASDNSVREAQDAPDPSDAAIKSQEVEEEHDEMIRERDERVGFRYDQ